MFGEALLHTDSWIRARRARVAPLTVRAGGHAWALFERAGDAPLVCLHGFAGDKENWLDLVRHLPGRHIIAPDLPPFGVTAGRDDALYGPRAQVARLWDLLDALGLERADFIGNSMGGHIALLAAHERPERVRRLVLLSPAGVEPPVVNEFERRLRAGENPFSCEDRASMQAFLELLFHRMPWIPGVVCEALAARRRVARHWLQRALDDYRAEWESVDEILPEVRQATLVVFGAEDRIVDPSCLAPLVDRLPRARGVMLPDCGHLPMLERPAQTARHVADFLDSPAELEASPSRG